jgi:acyl carrier protein
MPVQDPRVDTILDIIAHETTIDRALLKLDVSTEDLGISSLDVTLAIFSIEKHFDIDILSPLEAANDGPLTLGILIDHILALLPPPESRASAPAGA